jgi:FkbM family methyltransferase
MNERQMSQQQQHEQAIVRLIRPGPTKRPAALYDIGVGPKSEWDTLARHYPDMKIVGCEPSPDMRNLVIERGFTGELFPVAIDETAGSRSFTIHPSMPMASGFIREFANAQRITVETWTLDQFDEAAGFAEDILLWMDIEGMELPALRGGKRLLESGRVKWINLEERRGAIPCPEWTDPRELHRFLNSVGFSRRCDYNRHPTHQDAIYIHISELPAT